MDDMTNDDHEPVVGTSESHPAAGTSGDDPSPREEAQALGVGARAEPVATPQPAGVIPGLASARALPKKVDTRASHTRAQLTEFGRRFARIQEKNRRKARERAAAEKAKGLLTITFRCHKDHRRLMMGVMKNLNLTVEQMHKANLSTEPLEAAVAKLLRDFYKTR